MEALTLDKVRAVDAAAERRHAPELLTVQVLGLMLSVRGVEMSAGDLDHLAKQVLCAEELSATMSVLAKVG